MILGMNSAYLSSHMLVEVVVIKMSIIYKFLQFRQILPHFKQITIEIGAVNAK